MMESGQSRSTTPKQLAPARPQRLTISRGEQFDLQANFKVEWKTNAILGDDITPNTPQKSSRYLDGVCPTTETALPPTPASAGDGKHALQDDYESAPMKRKRAGSGTHDEDTSDDRLRKSRRVGVRPLGIEQWLEGELDVVDDELAVMEEKLVAMEKNLVPVGREIYELQSHQKDLEKKQEEQGKRLETTEHETQRDVQALQTVTQEHTLNIANLDETFTQRLENQARQATQLLERHNALTIGVGSHTTRLDAFETRVTANTTTIETVRTSVKDEAKKSQTNLRNHKTQLTRQITQVEDMLNGRLTASETDLKQRITKVDEGFKGLETKVEKNLEEQIPRANNLIKQIAKVEEQLKARPTHDEIQPLLSDADETRAALRVMIETGQGDQGRKLEELRADLASTLGKHHKDLDDKIIQVSSDLQMNKDALNGNFTRYDDRLNHLTKEHLEQRHRATALETSNVTFSATLSGMQSSLDVTQQTTNKVQIETASYQERNDATTSQHTLNISDLRTRVQTLEDKAATKHDPRSPFAAKFTPQTPGPPQPLSSASGDSPSDLVPKVKYLMERDTRNRKYIENHETGLVNLVERCERNKARVLQLEEQVKELKSEKEAMSEKQTALEQKFAKMEEQRALDKKRVDEAFVAMQRMAEDIAATKTTRSASVSDMAQTSQHDRRSHQPTSQQASFERLEQRIDDVSCKLKANKTISESKFMKVERLLDEGKASVSSLRSHLQQSIQASDHDHAKATDLLREDMEDRFNTAITAIQEESQRSRAASEKDQASLLQQLDVWWNEASNELQEATDLTDKRADERLTKYFGQVKVLLKDLAGRIDDVESAQRRNSDALDSLEPVKSFRTDVETLMQTFSDRIDKVEAAGQASTPVTQLSSAVVDDISDIRYNVDTLLQHRHMKDTDLANMRRNLERVINDLAALSAARDARTKSHPTAAQLSKLQNSLFEHVETVRAGLADKISHQALVADQRCHDRMEGAKASIEGVRESHNHLVDRVNSGGTPASYPSPPLQSPRMQSQPQHAIGTPYSGIPTHQYAHPQVLSRQPQPPPVQQQHVRTVSNNAVQIPRTQTPAMMYPSQAQSRPATPILRSNASSTQPNNGPFAHPSVAASPNFTPEQQANRRFSTAN